METIDEHRKYLWMSDSVCVASSFYVCNKRVSRAHGVAGRFRPVQEAITEGVYGRFKGSSLKPVSADIKGIDLKESQIN